MQNKSKSIFLLYSIFYILPFLYLTMLISDP